MADKFDRPAIVTDADMAFGGDMHKLMPEYSDIPKEFKDFNSTHPMVKLIEKWFFMGLAEGTKFIEREGINSKNALRHIRAIMVSFQPKHEHKIASCAYLLDKWFSSVIEPDLKLKKE
jgi:hypothetical protein